MDLFEGIRSWEVVESVGSDIFAIGFVSIIGVADDVGHDDRDVVNRVLVRKQFSNVDLSVFVLLLDV